MLFIFIRKLFWITVTVFILSIMSYSILLKDPLNLLIYDGGIKSYFYYIVSLLRGDLDISYNSGEPLFNQILRVFPATLSLCFSVTLLSLLIGIPLGFLSAYNSNNLVGKSLSILGSLSLAFPVFWLAIILLYYSSINQWEIAAVGELNPIYEIPVVTNFKLVDIFLVDVPYKLKIAQSLLRHLALPTLILVIPAMLEVMRMTQEQAIYVMKKDYVKVARTKGWSGFKIWRMHIVCNVLPPIIPAIARNIILIFAFAMLVENVVSWGGIGYWLINAVSVQDYNAISAGIIVIGLFILTVDVLASFITTLLDPSNKKDWYVK
ncbi:MULTISPECIES: ABC transporter permease [Pasteurellaceae]|uniref:ABC transporter permease subunit n=1 Tax=Pasteurella atlantica TaxID=2827233 RepID=A0AAW8CNU0_9PAST|nr:ABC transporter permease subunit [Pasteurella atlantica]MBR0573225.1 ABC transporter permease subunit [Pasteurella atlantica]MDP8039159.1 ABC transporter permease subunit [Pasteurella atlantica]MDP8041242.1 ABC transporter permease subunit [Pasteurella atlantica]MDP8043379.1 ABC transporter permease subunit [Pasteurella atlantica]MDP8045465.1 ABC transporter permease subunit [Pasteurella atlantica]